MIEFDLPPGVVRPVVTAPEPVLSTRCSEVDPVDPDVVQLAADLLATMAGLEPLPPGVSSLRR